MYSDIEIAQMNEMQPITEIARAAMIPDECIEPYGRYKAKLDPAAIRDFPKTEEKLILVTAMTPTPAGEGKTTTTIGLADALRRIGKRTMVALREPSLGPVFGIKGGAAGGGYAQVVPMEDINLHFTGDFHAITSANNLLAAMLDNHIHQGNALGIDVRRIVWKRCIDMNDRQLRNVVDGLGGSKNGMPREDGFDITVASEVMAILCLATDLGDLKERLGRIVVAYNLEGAPVTAADLRAHGAMAALLKDAVKPNLVQTLEGTPALVHGGPFANIAHGCNSLIATKTAMRLADYTVTEAGFGADLGAEKFLDIKCRYGGLRPSAVVIVATIRALKMHGGVPKNELYAENVQAVLKGLDNLKRHYENITGVYHLPAVIAINRFSADTRAETEALLAGCAAFGAKAVLCDVWAQGSAGGIELANEVVKLAGSDNDFDFLYPLSYTIEQKLDRIARSIYGGDGVVLTADAKKQLAALSKMGADALPVCVAKTQYSFSDNATAINAPTGFTVTVRNLRLAAGAGFVVALTGDIMTMPGLPKSPAAERIDVDEKGRIVGLF